MDLGLAGLMMFPDAKAGAEKEVRLSATKVLGAVDEKASKVKDLFWSNSIRRIGVL